MSRNKNSKDKSHIGDKERFADLLDNVKPLHEDHHNRVGHQIPSPKTYPNP